MCEISEIAVSASSNLLMVPGPESKSSFEFPTAINTEHGFRVNDGTQVPEPKMVTIIADLLLVIFMRRGSYLSSAFFSV